MSTIVAVLVVAALMVASNRGMFLVSMIPSWVWGIILGSALVRAGLNVYGWFESAAGLFLSILRSFLGLFA